MKAPEWLNKDPKVYGVRITTKDTPKTVAKKVGKRAWHKAKLKAKRQLISAKDEKRIKKIFRK